MSDLDLMMIGESEFQATLDINLLKASLAGESKINMSGLIDSADITTAGESTIRDHQLSINNLDITMSGETDVQLTVNSMIDITASEESKFRYKGDATIGRQEISDEASIVKVN